MFLFASFAVYQSLRRASSQNFCASTYLERHTLEPPLFIVSYAEGRAWPMLPLFVTVRASHRGKAGRACLLPFCCRASGLGMTSAVTITCSSSLSFLFTPPRHRACCCSILFVQLDEGRKAAFSSTRRARLLPATCRQKELFNTSCTGRVQAGIPDLCNHAFHHPDDIWYASCSPAGVAGFVGFLLFPPMSFLHGAGTGGRLAAPGGRYIVSCSSRRRLIVMFSCRRRAWRTAGEHRRAQASWT